MAQDNLRAVVPSMRAVLVAGSALVFVAGVLLYVLATGTDRFFAWTIGVPLTAAFLGAFYWTALILAGLSARERVWAWIRLGVPGVTVFVVGTLAATLLHLEQFHFDSEAFLPRTAAWGWLAVYIVQPVALVAAIVAQRRAPGRDPPRRLRLPLWLRLTGAGHAAVLLGYGVALFVGPESAMRWWPWPLTPLTARTSAAWLLGVGVIAAQGVWENDWRRIRLALVAYVALAVLQLGALVRFPDAVEWTRPGPWLYVGFLVTVLAVGLYGSVRALRVVDEPPPSP